MAKNQTKIVAVVNKNLEPIIDAINAGLEHLSDTGEQPNQKDTTKLLSLVGHLWKTVSHLWKTVTVFNLDRMQGVVLGSNKKEVNLVIMRTTHNDQWHVVSLATALALYKQIKTRRAK